jgi:hypothetical protein
MGDDSSRSDDEESSSGLGLMEAHLNLSSSLMSGVD